MSSITILTSTLNDAQKDLFYIGGPILMFISTLGCSLNLIVFTRRHLRKNPCSMCFIALNINHILYTFLCLIPAILQIGYNINPSAYNLIFCRCRYYLAFVLASLERFYLILACIDRTLITSARFRIKKWSNTHFIGICIGSLILFWILFHIHALINTNIFEYELNIFICAPNSGLYSILISFYSLIFNDIITPILMITFGLLTVKNIRQVRRIGIDIRVGVLKNEVRLVPYSQTLNAKERQMIILLFIELLVYIIFSFMNPIYLLYKQLTEYELGSIKKQMIEQFISTILLFITFIPYSINFYINLLVSKAFRKEIKKIFFQLKNIS
jgi:hypothetical protein